MPDALAQHVAEVTRGAYELLAELGRTAPHGTAFLARDLADRRVALLVATPDGESLDVVAALGPAVPAAGGRCTACGTALVTWADGCAGCHRALTPPPADEAPPPDATVLADAAGPGFAILGAVPHGSGGSLVFAREPGDGRVVAFAPWPDSRGGVWLDAVWERPGDAALPVRPPRPAPSATAPHPPPAPPAPPSPRRGLGKLFGRGGRGAPGAA